MLLFLLHKLTRTHQEMR